VENKLKIDRSDRLYLEELNSSVTKFSPAEIISKALLISKSPVITSSFGPFSGTILHALVAQKPDIKVIWVDTGYNTKYTYQYAFDLIKKLKLNVFIYVPKTSVGYRNIELGIPSINEPEHEIFTHQVKIEPFNRAMKLHKPDVWFTNLRAGQTDYRDSIDVFSMSSDGLLKVSPFYSFSDEKMNAYLKKHKLLNETRYYDPTKQVSNRECGLHLQTNKHS